MGAHRAGDGVYSCHDPRREFFCTGLFVAALSSMSRPPKMGLCRVFPLLKRISWFPAGAYSGRTSLLVPLKVLDKLVSLGINKEAKLYTSLCLKYGEEPH
eukprot:1384573-Amphidinium_carterae.1